MTIREHILAALGPEDDHPAAVSIEEFRALPWYRRAWWLLWH